MKVSTTAVTLALATLGSAQLQRVADFTATPTKLGMYAYVPKNLKTPAPLIVAVHHCQGSAQGYSTESHCLPLADQHGIILIDLDQEPAVEVNGVDVHRLRRVACRRLTRDGHPGGHAVEDEA